MARSYKRDKIGRFASTSGGGGAATAAKSREKKTQSRSTPKPPAAAAKPKSKATAKPKAAASAKPKGKAKAKATANPAPTKASKKIREVGNAATDKREFRIAGARAKNAIHGEKVATIVGRNRLKAHEEKIAGSSVENSVRINRYGRVVATNKGTLNNVSLQKAGNGLSASGHTITHNHPSAGNINFNAKIRGSHLTAGLSPADYKAAGSTGAKEIRAIGETRAYSFKPETSGRGRYGARVVKQDRILQENNKTKLVNDINNASNYAHTAVASTSALIERSFNSRIKAARSHWWNPMAQMKANKIAAMKKRSMKALAATESVRYTNSVMRSMKDAGYNVSARRNRNLVR